jgi:serine/threonine protein kinase
MAPANGMERPGRPVASGVALGAAGMRTRRIEAFDLPQGRVVGGKYVIDRLLGSGWEGEVYQVTELRTGIRRAAKIFYPQRNVRDRAVRIHARKLDRLRACPMIIRYHHTETFRYRRQELTCMISDLVEGELMEDFVGRQRGRRMQPFEALHLFHTLVRGIEQIHALNEYHGDVHDRNILVRRRGVAFDLTLLDLFHWGSPSRLRLREDIVQTVRVLYDAVGGRRWYASQSKEIKAICRGLRRDLILRRFPTIAALRRHLESFPWEG